MHLAAKIALVALTMSIGLSAQSEPTIAQQANEKAAKTATKSKPSPCKGLPKTQCTASAACTYVKETVRKSTGKKIAGYCRMKPKGKKS